MVSTQTPPLKTDAPAASANAPDTTSPPSKEAVPQPDKGPTIRQFANEAEMNAATIREIYIPGRFSQLLGSPYAGKISAKLAFDGIIAEAGNIKDSIERMLVEQYIMMHYRVAQLQVEAAESTQTERIKAYNTALARLLGEFRRLALTIRQYRLPISSRNFSVIHQQNVATTGGNQEVKYSQGAGTEKNSLSPKPEVNRSENTPEDLHALRERVARGERPQTSGSREAPLGQKAAVVA